MTQKIPQDVQINHNALSWGGISGILAFFAWIISLPVYGKVDPFIAGGLLNFPYGQRLLTISTLLCMSTAFFSMWLFITLFRVLSRTSSNLALYGTVSCIIGLVGIALQDASTYFAFVPLSRLYHSSTALPQTQAIVTILWDTTQGITYTFTFVGSLFLMVGFIVLGLAMKDAPEFGPQYGCTTIIIGVVGCLGVSFSLVVFETIGTMFLADLIFLLLIGRKLYVLSHV